MLARVRTRIEITNVASRSARPTSVRETKSEMQPKTFLVPETKKVLARNGRLRRTWAKRSGESNEQLPLLNSFVGHEIVIVDILVVSFVMFTLGFTPFVEINDREVGVAVG